MHRFDIRYQNTQGTLMRILTTVSRRGIDLHYVRAGAEDGAHKVTLLLDVNPRQIAQLGRDWRVIVDVLEVGHAIEVSAEDGRRLVQSAAVEPAPHAAAARSR